MTVSFRVSFFYNQKSGSRINANQQFQLTDRTPISKLTQFFYLTLSVFWRSSGTRMVICGLLILTTILLSKQNCLVDQQNPVIIQKLRKLMVLSSTILSLLSSLKPMEQGTPPVVLTTQSITSQPIEQSQKLMMLTTQLDLTAQLSARWEYIFLDYYRYFYYSVWPMPTFERPSVTMTLDYQKQYIWFRSWFHLVAIPRQKTRAGVMAVCPSASALVMFISNLSPISWIEDRDISAAAFLPASSSSSIFFQFKLPTTLHQAKLLTGYSMLELKQTTVMMVLGLLLLIALIYCVIPTSIISFLDIYYNSYSFSLILLPLFFSFYLFSYSRMEKAIYLTDYPVQSSIWIVEKFLQTYFQPIAFLRIQQFLGPIALLTNYPFSFLQRDGQVMFMLPLRSTIMIMHSTDISSMSVGRWTVQFFTTASLTPSSLGLAQQRQVQLVRQTPQYSQSIIMASVKILCASFLQRSLMVYLKVLEMLPLTSSRKKCMDITKQWVIDLGSYGKLQFSVDQEQMQLGSCE